MHRSFHIYQVASDLTISGPVVFIKLLAFNGANIDVEDYAVGFSPGENLMRLFRILIHAPEVTRQCI